MATKQAFKAEKFAKAIIAKRERDYITVVDAAAQIGISKNMITHYELTRAVPTIPVLVATCNWLRMRVADFF